MRSIVLFLTVLAVAPLQVAAQQEPRQPEPAALRPVRLAKWAALAGAGAAALYGLRENQRADDAFEQLESMCLEDAERCRTRTPAGAYADAALERQYQTVREHDGRARTSLVVGQVSVATSAVLFIIDLRNARPPRNIPFEPSRIEMGMSRDGGFSAALRLR